MQRVIRYVLPALAVCVCARADFLYVNSQAYSTPASIAGYRIAEDGSVTPLAGSPFATGGVGVGGGLFAVRRIVATPGGHLFSVNNGSQSISAFSIDPSTGALSPVPGSPFATDNLYLQSSAADISIAVSADEKFLFAPTE